ncbi:ABC transporter ATP-binding protein/permease [Anaerofustis stercorihominis]|uniref:ABC transporter, ATP-binding protein n=1 Tax=Anaerofustis stercorihominis DSM 17244 TaxID=445971 RepID=B1CC58_9FIRM|nr:ABC transporter ATP-binding protein [Anaerofustis stercorihominis]EDS71855.1 ABC transporter, ATP-binding protein [Anaerofustis stercorihominis DSM 17244]MCQ4796092.1 ABC transporter ATP-binding protein/permease [Anaerofustis stercorihominis]
MANKEANKSNYIKTAKRLLGYVFKSYKLEFFVVFIAIIISSVASMSSSLFLMYLIDDVITPLLKSAVPDFAGVLKAVMLFGVIYYTGVLCTFIYSRLMVNIGQGVLKKIRDDMFIHMQSLSIKYFDTHSHGELMSLYTNDTDTLRQMICQSIPQVFSAVITVIAVFCAMLFISIPLSVLAVFIIILMILATKIVGGKSGKYFVSQQKNLGALDGYVEEMMSGQKVVKVFCHEEESKAEFDELNESLFESAAKANGYANIIIPIIANLGYIQYVLTAILGGYLAISGVGGLTLGAIASFLQLTRNFNFPFSQISGQFNSIIMALAGAERIFKLIDEESEEDNGYVGLVNAVIDEDGNVEESEKRTGQWAWKHPHSDGSVTYTPLRGDVRFIDMSFGYNLDKIVLNKLNLYAKPGQKLAFVGSTGAGKTTITNLINRFYDVTKGKIRYDGINVNKIKKADLRRSLGIVLQDTNLFTGTIMDNIRYGKLDATNEEVYEAAKLVNADKFINMLPQGYDTMISGTGEELSQGQRQLLSIARAALNNPPVLILDEATSSIDTRTEKIVQDGMDELMKGRTVFVIAHRLSTIRNSDAIIVLEHGTIIERGDHEQLINKHGTYYRLYTGALELS